jgi:hypothetical protein
MNNLEHFGFGTIVATINDQLKLFETVLDICSRPARDRVAERDTQAAKIQRCGAAVGLHGREQYQ